MYSVEVNELQQTKISRTFPLGKALVAIAGAYYSKGEDITLDVILAITLELNVQCRPLSLVAWWLPQSDFPPSTRACKLVDRLSNRRTLENRLGKTGAF